MNLLSQLAWLYILRELIDLKVLFSLEATPCIRENILIKSRIDAEFYAESIYQLVENACIHSEEHRAWFGFRMHHTYRKGGMERFIRSSRIRERLFKKYKDCYDNRSNIFSQDYEYYMEFYVLNHSPEQVGIVPTYNRQTAEYNRRMDERYVRDHYDELRKRLEKEALERISADPTHTSLNEEAKRILAESSVSDDDLIQESANLLSALHRHEITEMDFFFTENDAPSESARVSGNSAPPEECFRTDVSKIIEHYGLRLLERIVSVNKGYLIGWSPNNPNAPQYYHVGKQGQSYNAPLYTTELCAVIPISSDFPRAQIQPGNPAGSVYGSRIEPARERIEYLNAGDYLSDDEIASSSRTTDEICRNAFNAYSQIQTAHSLSFIDLDKVIFQISISDSMQPKLEPLSKLLFALLAILYKKANDSQKAIRPRIAILFPNSNQLGEFIRLFSIFFLRNSNYLNNIQIALCTPSMTYRDTYCINFVLNGSQLAHIRSNATLFSYYDPKELLVFLPLLSYLESLEPKPEKSDPPVDSVFPFDLYLRNVQGQLPKDSQIIDPWKDSWFIDRTNAVIHTELQQREQGCAIKDIQVRLGSKLHLNCFYEAELLFHDTGIILRFAYLLAQEILYGNTRVADGADVLLVGYEDFSSALILQVEKWLLESGKFRDVHSVIVLDSTKDEPVSVKSLSPDLDYRNPTFEPIAILPIGTTLSTIYKMHNAIQKEFSLAPSVDPSYNHDDKNHHNYCFVLVNHELLSASNHPEDVTSRYWKSWSAESKTVTAQAEKRGGPTAKTKFLIAADAKWFAPEKCEICGDTGKEIRPVIDVKHSDTVPTSIFPLNDRRDLFPAFFDDVGPNTMTKNRKRIPGLFGSVSYSHISIDHILHRL